jgi:hypothetical protein
VIIPHSEFITGVVKNWTRTNTLGRIVIKVAVGYESDPTQVRDVLTEIARSHPQIAPSPPPSALLIGFGEKGLEFELRGIVLDVEKKRLSQKRHQLRHHPEVSRGRHPICRRVIRRRNSGRRVRNVRPGRGRRKCFMFASTDVRDHA